MPAHPSRLLATTLCALALAACEKPAIRTYVAPRDGVLDAVPPTPGAEAAPQLSWTLPAGWQQEKEPRNYF